MICLIFITLILIYKSNYLVSIIFLNKQIVFFEYFKVKKLIFLEFSGSSSRSSPNVSTQKKQTNTARSLTLEEYKRKRGLL